MTTPAPNTSTYIVQTLDTSNLPNNRVLSVGPGLSLLDSGPGGAITIAPTLNLAGIVSVSTNGLYVRTGSNTAVSRSLTSDSTLNITYPDGVFGNPFFQVNPNTSIQNIFVQSPGQSSVVATSLNFIAGFGAKITLTNNASVANILIEDDGMGSIVGGTFVTTTNQLSILPNSFSLGSLTTGLIKNSVSGGVSTLSTAVANTDYPAVNASYVVQTATNAPSGSYVLGTIGTGILKNTTGTGVLSIAISNTDYASPLATYIVQTATNAPPDVQVLSSLSTGLVKVTTGTGLLSTAVGNTDYAGASATYLVAQGGPTPPNSINLGVLATGVMLLTNNGAAPASFSTLGIDVAGGVASADATYLVAQGGPTPPNSINLGSLATGVMLLTNNGAAPASFSTLGIDVAGGVAGADATYLVAQGGPTPPNSINLGSLATGVMILTSHGAAPASFSTLGIDVAGGIAGADAIYLVAQGGPTPPNSINLGILATGVMYLTNHGGGPATFSTLGIDVAGGIASADAIYLVAQGGPTPPNVINLGILATGLLTTINNGGGPATIGSLPYGTVNYVLASTGTSAVWQPWSYVGNESGTSNVATVNGSTGVTVNAPNVQANSSIFLTYYNIPAGTAGELYIKSISPGNSFVVGAGFSDTSSKFMWVVINNP